MIGPPFSGRTIRYDVIINNVYFISQISPIYDMIVSE